ncbi:MAG: immunoglobulin-like domain-containing protein, partial [Opitutae bacterium]
AEYIDSGVSALDDLDGAITVHYDSEIPTDGLVLHLDAESLSDLHSHGDTITSPWTDLSGEGNHADNISGDPKWIEDGLNGRPIVNFDGDDLIWTTKNFEPDLANYTIISIARYTGGGNGRVISTRARNYMFGFHGGSVRRFHSDGWAANSYHHDTIWHLHVGDVNDQDRANFWVDGRQYANNSTGLHNTNYKPDQIQLGGWLTNREMSKCEVAELIIYNRVLTAEERTKLSNLLNYKYALTNGGGFAYVTVDTSQPSTHNIKYSVHDNSGNHAEVVRTVIVSGDETKPFILLNGEVTQTIEAGSISDYTDPGAVAKSADGTTLKDDLSGQGDAVDLLTPGTYTLAYDFSDAGGNAADTAVRSIKVVDTLGPAITLTGDEPLELFVDGPFQDPGATSVDQRDGETVVYSDYLPIPDTLRLEYHTRSQAIELMYLENEGGVLAHAPAVSGYFTDGIHGDGINFLNDQDFIDISGVNRYDGYQLVLSGLFDARRDGNYGFAASKQDGNDYCTIWVDKDQDGILEKNGDLGDEQVVWDNKISTVHLSRGKYRVVIAYSEWNGNSRFNARFSTPEGAGPFSLTNIHPGGPGQEGLWSTIPRVIDTSVPGQHTITYFADDKLGNRSTLDRTIIVEEDTQRPIIHLLGEKGLDHHVGFPYRDAGVLLDDYQGNPLDESQVKITGIPDGLNLGSYTILYEYTDPEGHVALPVTRTVIVKDIVAPIITLNGVNPATVQLNQKYVDPGAVAIDAFDGQLPAIHNLGFNKEGLVLHLDAGSFKGKLNNGDVIAIDWEDLSGKGNHANNQVGDPKWLESALNGQPVVDFNGNDIIWTTKDFEPDLAHYSIFSVARYSGNNRNRVISSRGRNWFFGFHGNTIRRFHSDGWAWNQGGADENWHIHIGDVNDQDQANFWLDGTHLAKNSNGLHDTNYKPRNINLGGYNDSNERSNCQIAELLLFDRVLSAEDREYIELYLKSKYNLNGGGDLFFSPVDTTKAGEYTYTYKST